MSDRGNFLQRLYATITVDLPKMLQTVIEDLERRRTERRVINHKSNLINNGARHPIHMVDVSCFGMKIEGVHLEVGQHIQIEWEQFQFISGTVMWTVDNSAGVEFDKALSLNHPLFGEQNKSAKVTKSVKAA